MTTELQEKLTQDLERVLKEVEQSLIHLDQSLTYITAAKISLYGQEIKPTMIDRVTDIHTELADVRRDLVHIPDDIKKIYKSVS